jgi:predicted enzyme related to lactoylglutathione lyase
MAGEVSFFEVGVADPEKAREFYGELLGWSFEPGPSGEGSVIKAPGIPGGLHGGDKGASVYVFFNVDNMDAAIEKVRELGGDAESLDQDESSEKSFGRFFFCRDDQGSKFGLHQPPRQ